MIVELVYTLVVKPLAQGGSVYLAVKRAKRVRRATVGLLVIDLVSVALLLLLVGIAGKAMPVPSEPQLWDYVRLALLGAITPFVATKLWSAERLTAIATLLGVQEIVSSSRSDGPNSDGPGAVVELMVMLRHVISTEIQETLADAQTDQVVELRERLRGALMTCDALSVRGFVEIVLTRVGSTAAGLNYGTRVEYALGQLREIQSQGAHVRQLREGCISVIRALCDEGHLHPVSYLVESAESRGFLVAKSDLELHGE